jgi:hypothetical protein
MYQAQQVSLQCVAEKPLAAQVLAPRITDAMLGSCLPKDWHVKLLCVVSVQAAELQELLPLSCCLQGIRRTTIIAAAVNTMAHTPTAI